MLIGYWRVSTRDQKYDLQRDALLAAGVPERYLYGDKASGARTARPGLAQCLQVLRSGDTLVVWKLDRLARSLLHLQELAAHFRTEAIGLHILDGLGAALDLQSTAGKLFFDLLGAFAEFEREMIRERVIAGLEAARARGHKGGRRPVLSPDKQRQAQALRRGGEKITAIAQTLGCSRRTIYKALAAEPPRP